jgi:transcription elongation factor GreA
MTERYYVTAEGLEKLKAELERLQARSVEVAAAIEHARSLGDLSENAEYHAAKEEQAHLHAKIRDIESKITRAVVVDPSQIDTSKVRIGATVRLRNLKTQKDVTYTLVSSLEADLASGKISIESPVGRALLGKAVGEQAVAKVPAGELILEVLDIQY